MKERKRPRGTETVAKDHFMTCPVCGKVFNRRKLEQSLMHMHDGPESDDAPAQEKAVAKEAGKLS
jgi:hypothetical protein